MELSDFRIKTDERIFDLKKRALEDGSIVPLLEFPLLASTGIVEHCFTTREGGVSEGIFAEMNLSYSRGDRKESVDENYRRLARALHVSEGDFVCSHQTHTINVRRVGEKEKGSGVTRERKLCDVDGLITDEPGVVLATSYADCVPLFFVDPVHRAIGLSHSGWRGTVKRMGQVTVDAMNKEFGSEPSEIYAAVGPSICRDCYEVGGEVAEQFAAEFAGHKGEIITTNKNGKYQLDLWRSNEIVLTEAGILPEHLAVTNICTCCNPSLLFSHRASQGRRGNLGAFMYLKE